MDGLDYISFDLDNTLVSVSFDKTLYNEIIPRLYAEKEETDLEDAKQYVYAEYYKAKYINQVHDWTSIRRWIDHFDLGEPDDIFDRLEDLSEAYPDVKDTLSAFSEVAEVVVFSNTNRHFLNIKTSIHSLDEHVDTARSGPYDYGHHKTERDAWEAYLEDLNTDPDSIIHIGDRVADDIDAPSSLGITTYRLNRHNSPKGKGYQDLHTVLDELR